MSDTPATQAADGDGGDHVHAVRRDDRGAARHQPARRGDPLRAGRPCPVRGAGTLRPLPRARRERRGRSGAATPACPPPRSSTAGRWPARRTSAPAPSRSTCPSARRRRCARTGTPSPSRSRCPSPATTCRTRRSSSSSSRSSRRRWTDNTSDFDRLRRALGRQHGIEELRAELPQLRRLGTALRHANWKVTVALEMRDWVYELVPPAALAARATRRRSRRRAWGSPSTSAPLRWSPTWSTSPPAASSTRRAPTTSRSPAATTSSAASSTPSASTGSSGCRSSPWSPSTTCSRSCSSATASRCARSTRSPSPATRR